MTPSCKLPGNELKNDCCYAHINLVACLCEAFRKWRWRITAPTWHTGYVFIWKLRPVFCYYLVSDDVLATQALPVVTHSKSLWACYVYLYPLKLNTVHAQICSSDERQEVLLKNKVFHGNKSTDAFHIYLYPQTQQTEPILIWLRRLLSSTYWMSKYSHGDKKKQKGQPAAMIWGEDTQTTEPKNTEIRCTLHKEIINKFMNNICS